jgi:DNA-binding response OmpR family regulator
MKMRILLIEDDERLSAMIRTVLEQEKYVLDVENNGDTGLEAAMRGVHDLVIMDWMLPGRDGPSICRLLRAARVVVPILMLTARSQVEDRVAGLESGADDYLVKPFALEELIARIRALTRRSSSLQLDVSELRVGTMVMDIKAHTARRGEKVLELTKREWDMLECFLRHPGQTLSRREIMDYVWSYDASIQPEMVDVYVSYLRPKLTITGRKDPINTVRGFGYQLDIENA